MSKKGENVQAKNPNLIVLGAQKCGTTTLHKTLDCHPDIFASKPIKEARFFVDDSQLAKQAKQVCSKNPEFGRIEDRESYLSNAMKRGYAGEKFFLESSPQYTYGNFARDFGVPSQIRDLNPDAQFIYIMRDPFERLFSAYLHAKRHGGISKQDEFTEYFRKFGKPSLRTSLYWYQISYFLKYFPKQRFLLLKLEDLIRSPASVMERVLSFLGLPIWSLPVRIRNVNPIRRKEPYFDIHKNATIREIKHEIVKDLENLRTEMKFEHQWTL